MYTSTQAIAKTARLQAQTQHRSQARGHRCRGKHSTIADAKDIAYVGVQTAQLHHKHSSYSAETAQMWEQKQSRSRRKTHRVCRRRNNNTVSTSNEHTGPTCRIENSTVAGAKEHAQIAQPQAQTQQRRRRKASIDVNVAQTREQNSTHVGAKMAQI